MKLLHLKPSLYLAFIGITLICTGIILFNLNNTRLYEWDECVYAQYGKEMKQTGNWLYYTWNALPIFEKPPLYGWFMQIPFAFGVNDFTARILSLIGGITTVIFTYGIGIKFFSRRTAFFAATLLLTSHIFTVHSRFVTTDTLVMLFFLIGTLLLMSAVRSRNNPLSYLAGVFFAAAFLQKGANIYIFQAGLYSGLLIYDRKHWNLILRSALVSVLLILPWHIYMYITHGYAFYYEYIVENLILRSTRVISFESHSLIYLYYLARDYALWIGFIGLGYSDKHIRKNYIIVIIFAALIPFLVFSFLVKTRHVNYIVPLYPFVALWIAYYMDFAISWVKNKKVQRIVIFVCVLVIVVQAIYTTNYVMHNSYMTPGLRQNLYDVYDAIKQRPEPDLYYLVLPEHRNPYSGTRNLTPVSLHMRYSPTPCVKYYTDKKVHIFYSVDEFNKTLLSKKGLYLISNSDISQIHRIRFSLIYNNSDFQLFTR